MTGTEQRVTSAYHPQSNGLCERQNRTIKDSLVKILEENQKEWPNVIQGVLFAHRVSVHYSTKFSPFFLLYNRHPTLPIDIQYNLVKESYDNTVDEPYDYETFRAVLNSSSKIREVTQDKASQNIKKAQEKQQKDYNKRHSTLPSTLPVGSKVLLQNLKRQDRKGGKFTYKWIGPYTIESISKTGLCALTNQKGVTLKKKYNVSLLKPFYSNERTALEFDKEEDPEPQAQSTNCNYFDQLPYEIVDMILAEATEKQDVDTFNAVRNTCLRFRSIVEEKRDDILPLVYLDFYENVLQSLPRRGNKIKAGVNKLSKHFGPNSGAIDDVRKAIGKKNWRSPRLLIEKRKYNWFVIGRVFWKKRKLNTIQDLDIITDMPQDQWLHNRMYILIEQDKAILLSKDEWLNDRIMDPAQKLIYDEIGTASTFQTVLNSQKKVVKPYRAVSEEHVQLLYDGCNHWFLSFCSNGRGQVCDSLNTTLTRSSRKSIQSFYKHYFAGDEISFLPVQRQPDGCNCGLFATAFAAEILDGKSPSEAIFSVDEMRGHLISFLEMQKLSPFPKLSDV